MPINNKLLQGPYCGVPQHTTQQKIEATQSGEKIFLSGGTHQHCPSKFLPKPGDNVLSQCWMTGYEGAKMAAGVVVKS